MEEGLCSWKTFTRTSVWGVWGPWNCIKVRNRPPGCGERVGLLTDQCTTCRLEEIALAEDLKDDEIEVDMLCTPVNPSDINQIQG